MHSFALPGPISQVYKPEMPDITHMELNIIVYIILFLLAFMIARVIMKIIRGY